MRVVFMGSPDFALPALQSLVDSEHEVVAVYSQPPRPAGRGQKERPSPVHELAEKHHIPVYTPESLKQPEAQAQFATHNADVAVVAAYGLLLPKPILDAPKHGCVNIHPSLLPRWRGAAPIQRAVMAGDTHTGCCIMQMEEGLDSGPILLHDYCAIPTTANAGEMHDTLANMGAKLLLEVLADITNFTPRTQPEDGVTYAHKLKKDDCQIIWSQPAGEIINMIRGLSPFPAAWTNHDDTRIKIFQAELVEQSHDAAPGTVLDDQLTIACGAQAIRPAHLQRPGKKVMERSEFLNGYPIASGSQLT